MKRFLISLVVLLFFHLPSPAYDLQKGKSLLKGLKEAAALYESGSATDADKILNWVFEDQNTDPDSRNFGCWGWVKGGPNRDLNVPLFSTPSMFIDLWAQKEKMSAGTRDAYEKACERITTAVERRFKQEHFPVGRDRFDYTNAFCAYVESLTIIAYRTGDVRLKKKAVEQWNRFYRHWMMHSFSEFMSSHYDDVDFNSIMNIRRYAADERIKAQAKELLDDLFIAEAAASHPVLKENIVGSSRDYRERQKGGDCRAAFLVNPPADYEIPAKALELLNQKKYPFEFEGRAGALTFTYKSYQLEDAGLGTMTGWGNYFWQQLHLVAAAGRDENHRATVFAPGVNNPINGFTDQKGMSALLVYNRAPSLWHLTSGKGADVKSTLDPFGIGTSDGFTILKNDPGELVLSAYGYDFHFWPFEVAGGRLRPCSLTSVHRGGTSASKRYHNRKADFTEYIFPEDNDWMGAVVKVVKSGTKLKAPRVSFTETDGVTVFEDSADGLLVKVGLTPQGASVAIPRNDLYTMPRRKMNQ